MNYKFILVDSETGKEQAYWILPPPVTVGRSPDVEVSIGDPSISRRHCQFTIDSQGALVVRDLDSMNGTYVNHSRVKKTVLQPGSLVKIGGLCLRVEWTTADVVERPAIGSTGNVNATQPMRIIPKDLRKPGGYSDGR